MLGFVFEVGGSALRLSVAAGSLALLVAVLFVAFMLPPAVLAVRAGFAVVGAILGGALSWAFFGGAASDHATERAALELRAAELNGRSLAPGSPLACLDAVPGALLDAACERVLFASPASVASATAYVAARLDLLSDIAAYAARGGAGVDDILHPLRRSLEADRYGFVAHVLAKRDGCTSKNCRPMTLLRETAQVRANLGGGRLEQYVAQYQAVWTKAAEAAPADGKPAPAPAADAASERPRKTVVNIDFPSAASIPPVSIMHAEPTGPVLPGIAAAAAANPNPQPTAASSRRTRKQNADGAPQAAAQAVPSRAASVEPIWPEPVPPPPSGPAAASPVQLNPNSSPNANSGAASRGQ
jgi:hypothetical protein